MLLLLDTHTILWSSQEPGRLSGRVRDLLIDRDNELFISIASCWEIAIKTGLGKLTLHVALDQLVRREIANNAMQLLPIDLAHVLRVANLPLLHRDPFDRLLVAQAQHQKMTLVSQDPLLARYDVPVVW